MNPPTLNAGVFQAYLLGALRIMAGGATMWLIDRGAGPEQATFLGLPANYFFAAIFATFAMTGQGIDVLSVTRRLLAAQTTTTATLTQPADTQTPTQLTAKIEPAPPPSPQPEPAPPTQGN